MPHGRSGCAQPLSPRGAFTRHSGRRGTGEATRISSRRTRRKCRRASSFDGLYRRDTRVASRRLAHWQKRRARRECQGEVEHAKIVVYDPAVELAQQNHYQAMLTADSDYEAAMYAVNPTDMAMAIAKRNTDIDNAISDFNATVQDNSSQYANGSLDYSAMNQQDNDAALAEVKTIDQVYLTFQETLATAGEWDAENQAEATYNLKVATDQANHDYDVAMAQAAQTQSDSVADAVQQRDWAQINAESTLTQAVANADAQTVALWAAQEGTPWAQYQADLAANEAAYVDSDAPQQAVLDKAEADAQHQKAYDLATATLDNVTATANAQQQLGDGQALAQETYTLEDAPLEVTRTDDSATDLQVEQDALAQNYHDNGYGYYGPYSGFYGSYYAYGGYAYYGGYYGAYYGSLYAYGLWGYGGYDLYLEPEAASAVHDYIESTGEEEQTWFDANAGLQVTAATDMAQAQSDYNVAIATANADYDEANAQADRNSIVTSAKAQQAGAIRPVPRKRDKNACG